MGHVLKASLAMVSLSALVAAAIAFVPHAPKFVESSPVAAAPIPAGALTRPAFAEPSAPPPAPAAPATRGVARAKPAATEVAEAHRKLAAAMARPKSEDGLTQIALAAGGASSQSALGRPAGQTRALAFAAPGGPGESAEATADLIRRAKAQLRDGAASSARLLLSRAARGGSAEALSLLGQSYDAAALSELGVKGVRADPREARKYYQQAVAAGSEDTRTRLARLGG